MTPSSPQTNGVYSLLAEEYNQSGVISTSARLVLSITTVIGDYDGDGKADVAVFRPLDPDLAMIYVNGIVPRGSPNFGGSLDIPFQGDVDGDGKTDLIVYRPSTLTFYIEQSAAGFEQISFGAAGDIPVVGNFDGTNRTEVGVYRPSTGQWFIYGHSDPIKLGGQAGDIPIPADYDGVGRDELAVFRPSTGQWFIQGHVAPIKFGVSGDQPVPGDYSGDGKDQLAVFRPSTGQFFMQGRATGINFAVGDIPAPGDYDGTGRDEFAVFRPSDSPQWITKVQGHDEVLATLGVSGDIPLASPYHYRDLPIATEVLTTLDFVNGSAGPLEPADNVTATIGKFKPPVASVILSQPSSSGTQTVSLTLEPSPAEKVILKDFRTGKPLRKIKIALQDANGSNSVIRLTDAAIASFETLNTSNGGLSDRASQAEYTITLVTKSLRTGSITASIDGLHPPLQSVSFLKPTALGEKRVSLTLTPSAADPQLMSDALRVRHLAQVTVMLPPDDTSAGKTLTLTNVLVESVTGTPTGSFGDRETQNSNSTTVTLIVDKERIGPPAGLHYDL